MGLNKCSKCHHEWQTVDYEDNVCSWCGALGYTIQSESLMEKGKYGKLKLIEDIKKGNELVKYVKVKNSFRFFWHEHKHSEAVNEKERVNNLIGAAGFVHFCGDCIAIPDGYSTTLKVYTPEEGKEELAKLFGVVLRREF